MPNRRQEQFCRDEFDRWLRTKRPGSSICWRDGSEPPDSWLILGEEKYAVEITTIQCEDDKTVVYSHTTLAKEAEEDAARNGQLSGTYLVESYGRIDNFMKRKRRAVKVDIVRYVESTRSVTAAEKREIRLESKTVCTISKRHENGARIHAYGFVGPEGCLWEDHARQVQVLIQNCTGKKEKKLAQIPTPKILVLYDLSGLFCRERFTKYVQSAPSVHRFEAVYVVEDKEKGYIAFRCGEWPCARG